MLRENMVTHPVVLRERQGSSFLKSEKRWITLLLIPFTGGIERL